MMFLFSLAVSLVKFSAFETGNLEAGSQVFW